METVTEVRVKGEGEVLDQAHPIFKSLPHRIRVIPAGIFRARLSFSNVLKLGGKRNVVVKHWLTLQLQVLVPQFQLQSHIYHQSGPEVLSCRCGI